MNNNRIPTRSIAILLIILIMGQGCTAYKGSITLDEAVTQQKKVKVITTKSKEPIEFERIDIIEGAYKGLPKRYSQSEEVILQKEDIVSIKEQDKLVSNLITFSPLIVIVGVGILLFGSDN